MNLTNLRRLVLLLDVAALAGAGAAAWFSVKAAPAAAKDWQKLFPVRTVPSADLQASGPGPKEQYVASISYPQGDKPAPVVAAAAGPVVVVDDFLTKYKLNGLYVGATIKSSYAQLQFVQGGAPVTFTVGLGCQIPAEIGTAQEFPPLTPWRLNELVETPWDPKSKQPTKCAAVFIHNETGERKVLEMDAGNPIVLQAPEAPSGAGIGTLRQSGPDRKQPFRGRQIQTGSPDRIEWEVAEEELDYLEVWSSDQVSRISAVEAKDDSGAPDGFVLKGVPADTRAYEVGFRQEDKIISVNDEKVSSTADAMAKGKKQFDGGTTVFQLKVLRKGREMTWTFHAPKKKAKP
jgi:hypothetical protein